MNKTIWRDIFQAIKHTKGQFMSILGLMMIGAFALVGLMVTGPDMRETGNDYAQKLNTPDLNIISTYGLDKKDTQKISQAKGVDQAEFGYMTDTTVTSSKTSFRLFSKPQKLGKYEIRSGRLPKAKNEIALAEQAQKHYHLGQTITFSEKKNVLGQHLLKRHRFKIVGFVRSSLILSNVNLGQSTSGTGELKGYGVVSAQAFHSELYTMANVTYKNLRGFDSYSKAYAKRQQKDKQQLEQLLKQEKPHRKQRIQAAIKKQLEPQKIKLQTAQIKLTAKEQQLTTAKAQLSTGQALLNQSDNKQLAQTLKQKKLEYETNKHKLTKAKTKLAAGQKKLTQAANLARHLPALSYTVANRRELPGGEGNLVYTTVAQVVDDLAKVFPIFLYFVAALVTFTTMNRFIDEERINSGTLKALGYDDRVIINKFTFYGFVSGTLGTILGIWLGHTLLPQIVYHAYYQSLTLPPIELHFYWQISLIALILSWLSSVLPAYLTAKNELTEKPANFLLPKAPAKGATILLEKISFIWQHLNFTHKVTARNIFRYKKRMLMTIFGVCGATTLLFAGFAVKNSISSINERQFSDLIHYNMIVAQNPTITKNQKAKISTKLHSNSVKSAKSIYYESLTKTAGKNNDAQNITMIVPQSTKNLQQYINLNNRKTNHCIPLSDHGVVISEHLAAILHAQIGSKITLTAADNQTKTMKISGITEMYMGHFIFMNKQEYQRVFDRKFNSNAHMIILRHNNSQTTQKEAAQFMKINGVAGVVQNTAISKEIDAVVQALNMIMIVLIVVAGLLAIVILYNLTNINIAERIRELSTIKVLGFFDNEVTMYIYRETILLTSLGILVGYGIGDLLFRYILFVAAPDNTMFNPSLSASSFLWPLGVIGIITIILGFVVNNKLKNVDMLEALKSVD